ncbi:ATP synthase subunit d, mitochondrial [Aphelenchoides bicaudatus]|nr:ATP synthase subunit d, mitochondrial [Aphelenchoides bicaudatus]
MSAAAKRISHSTVNWAKLSESLTAAHNGELSKLKGQNSVFSSVVNQLPADLPKIDFAALKKQMPTHSNTLDALQKQYEALKIPYGEIPAALSAEIEKWNKYNEARVKLQKLKTAYGAEEAKKVEQKWAKAPPVEHFSHEHYSEYFPQIYADLRYQERIPDPCELGFNDREMIESRFKDYKVLRRPDKVDDH